MCPELADGLGFGLVGDVPKARASACVNLSQFELNELH